MERDDLRPRSEDRPPPPALHRPDAARLRGPRRAIISGAADIAATHVRCWQESYAGLLPQDLLNACRVHDRAAMWAAILGSPATNGARVRVAEASGLIMGFASCGRQRDDSLGARGFTGEIGALYVLRSYQRSGVGRALMGMMAHDLAAGGLVGASLWVLADNHDACRLYDRLGGLVIGQRMVTNLDRAEVAYGWSNLFQLT